MTSKIDVQEIVVDGETYVKKSTVCPVVDVDYCIIRTERAGVHAGTLVRREGQEVELANARRLWYWDGAASLSQLAMQGVSKPHNCKFTVPVTTITLLGVIEVIPCTEKAILSIAGVKEWKA